MPVTCVKRKRKEDELRGKKGEGGEAAAFYLTCMLVKKGGGRA